MPLVGVTIQAWSTRTPARLLTAAPTLISCSPAGHDSSATFTACESYADWADTVWIPTGAAADEAGGATTVTTPASNPMAIAAVTRRTDDGTFMTASKRCGGGRWSRRPGLPGLVERRLPRTLAGPA
jgi:hypothetical protein